MVKEGGQLASWVCAERVTGRKQSRSRADV